MTKHMMANSKVAMTALAVLTGTLMITVLQPVFSREEIRVFLFVTLRSGAAGRSGGRG